jgi:hypothetical protein
VEHVTSTLTRPAGAVCSDCGDAVLRSGDLLLDADVVTGGLYDVGPGRRRRRSLREMADEHRARRAVHGGGHDVHECAPATSWYDR